MPAYYNEIDPQKAAWLRELIREKVIADGEVDERSIAEINPQKLAGFTQCHFFAGIGVWSYALRLAGWPDDRPCWTGSCPCGPFSSAGLQKGFLDERHLWPEWFRLVNACRPVIIFGEQVAAAGVVGSADADMQHLLRKQVLYQLSQMASGKRWSSQDMQRLFGDSGEGETESQTGNGSTLCTRIPREQSSVLCDNKMLRDGEAEGIDVRSRQTQGRIDGSDSPGSMRGDRIPIRPERPAQTKPETSERTFHRQNGLFERLYDRQRADSVPSSESSNEHMGRSGGDADTSSVDEESITDDGSEREIAEEAECGDSGPDGGTWIDLVFSQLEETSYACAASVLTASGVGAPHIRQRLYFVAHAADGRRNEGRPSETVGEQPRAKAGGFFSDGSLAHPESERLREARRSGGRSEERSGDSRESGELGNPSGTRFQERECDGRIQRFTLESDPREATERRSHVNGFWRDADWILRKRWNRDDWEWCPTEPGTQSMVDGSAEDIQRMRRKNYETFPLACGVKGRVLKLKGYGDAICAPLAAEFIRCYMTI